MKSRESVIEEIRTLVAELQTEDRLAVITAIDQFDLVPDDQDDMDNHKFFWEEQEAWFARPGDERQPYRGQFVAVHGGQVIDQDTDQRALLLRVRKQFGATPIPILDGDWDSVPEIV